MLDNRGVLTWRNLARASFSFMRPCATRKSNTSPPGASSITKYNDFSVGITSYILTAQHREYDLLAVHVLLNCTVLYCTCTGTFTCTLGFDTATVQTVLYSSNRDLHTRNWVYKLAQTRHEYETVCTHTHSTSNSNIKQLYTVGIEAL